jgi:hypothetical protein
MTNELVSLILKITRQQQIEIEEYCLCNGKTFSEYFVGLHEENFRGKLEDLLPVMETDPAKKQRGRPPTKGK